MMHGQKKNELRFDQLSLYFPAAAINVLHSDELPKITSGIKYNLMLKADILKISVSTA